jgi:chromosome segregation ATPase
MWTGRQTLASIESTLGRLHAEEGELDTALRSAVADAGRLRKERVEALRELARIKLDELQAGRLVSDLDAAERRAQQMLSQRREKLVEATKRRETAVGQLEHVDAAREAAAAAVEKALDDVEAVRAAAEAKVKATDEWRAAKAAFEAADAVASAAEQKATASQEELGAKKKPYDNDPLFAYLWTRGLGTSRYSANRLVKFIDERMAKFIGFDNARANYAMLLEIPQRLGEHAARQRAMAVERKAKLSQLERRAMVEAGIEAKERELAAARQVLAGADAEFQKSRDLLREADERRARMLAESEDTAYNEALSTIVAGDSQDDLATLYREARRTATPADEAIVRKLEETGERIAKADAEVAGLRRSAQDLARRRMEVERVRDRFRDAGYDHPHTTFGNDGELARVLQQILKGAVQSGLLWELLRRGYGFRRSRGRPDFGGHFPFPIPGGGSPGPIGGDWREPRSGGDWSPKDDDRFTTGGSF